MNNNYCNIKRKIHSFINRKIVKSDQKMFLVYNKYTGRFPVDRFMFALCISLAFMMVLLYVAIVNHVTNEYEDEIEDKEFLKVKFGIPIEDPDEISSEMINQFAYLNASEMERLSHRMEDRRQMVRESCVKMGMDMSSEPNGWEFLINKQHHLIWCNIFKAASTTWLYNFNILGGYTQNQAAHAIQPQWLARQIYPRPSGQELLEAHSDPGSVAFIIVRHPFERLSSAYRDKMLSGPPMGMYTNLAEEIIMKHRKKRVQEDESFLHQLWPTFTEFVNYILTESKSNRTLDIHWSPYTSFCSLCQFDFDVIVKFETFEEDQNFLVQKAGLTNLLSPHCRNSGVEKKDHKGKETTDILQEHYSQLTRNKISELYELYKSDFEIFNYSADEYYKMAKEDSLEESEEDETVEESDEMTADFH